MFSLKINKSQITVNEKETIVSGASKIYEVSFEFDDSWLELTKTAIFKAGNTVYAMPLEEEKCLIPWEITEAENSGEYLWIGVYGSDAEGKKLPTLWNMLGLIQPGASEGKEAREPSPSVLSQIIAAAKQIEEAASRAEAQIEAAAAKAGEEAATFAKEAEKEARKAYEYADQARISSVSASEYENSAYSYALKAEGYAKSIKDIIIKSPEDIQALVRSGSAPEFFSLGDSILIPTLSGKNLRFEIIDFDSYAARDEEGVYAPHTMLLQLSELYENEGQYCAPEAYFVAPYDIAPGYYRISGGVYSDFYFYLPVTVKSGSQFVFPQSAFGSSEGTQVEIFDGYESFVPSLTLSVLRNPEDYISYSNLEESINNDANMCKYSNGTYEFSSINAFLCGSVPERAFSRPSSSFSRLTSFYNDLDEDFRAIIAQADDIYTGSNATAPVFLLSAANCDVEGGTALEYFMKKGTAVRCDKNGAPQSQWLRKTSSSKTAQGDVLDKDGKVYVQDWSRGRAFLSHYFAPCVLVA